MNKDSSSKVSSERLCVRCKQAFSMSYQFCTHCGYGVLGQASLALTQAARAKKPLPDRPNSTSSSYSNIKLEPLEKQGFPTKRKQKGQKRPSLFSKSAVSLPFDEKIENLRAKYKQQSKSLIEQSYAHFYRSIELEQRNSLNFEEIEHPQPIIRASVSAPSFNEAYRPLSPSSRLLSPHKPVHSAQYLGEMPSIAGLYRQQHGSEVVYVSYTDLPDRLLQQPVKVIPDEVLVADENYSEYYLATMMNTSADRPRASPVVVEEEEQQEQEEEAVVGGVVGGVEEDLSVIAQRGAGLWSSVANPYDEDSDDDDKEAADPVLDSNDNNNDNSNGTQEQEEAAVFNAENQPNQPVGTQAEALSASCPPATPPLERMTSTLHTQAKVYEDMLGDVQKMRGHYLEPSVVLPSAMLASPAPSEDGYAEGLVTPTHSLASSQSFYSYYIDLQPDVPPSSPPPDTPTNHSLSVLRDKGFVESMTEWWEYVERVRGEVGGGRGRVLEEVEAMFTPRSEVDEEKQPEEIVDETQKDNTHNLKEDTKQVALPPNYLYIPPDSLPLSPPPTPAPPLSDSPLVQDSVYERYLERVFSLDLHAREVRSERRRGEGEGRIGLDEGGFNPFLLMPSYEDDEMDKSDKNDGKVSEEVKRLDGKGVVQGVSKVGGGDRVEAPLPAALPLSPTEPSHGDEDTDDAQAHTTNARKKKTAIVQDVHEEDKEKGGLGAIGRIMRGMDERDGRARGRHKLAQSVGRTGKGLDEDEIIDAAAGTGGLVGGRGGGMFGVVWEDEEGEVGEDGGMDWLFALADQDDRQQRGSSRGWGKGGVLAEEFKGVSEVVKRAARNQSNASARETRALVSFASSPSTTAGSPSYFSSSPNAQYAQAPPAHIQLSSLFMQTNTQLKKLIEVLEDVDPIRTSLASLCPDKVWVLTSTCHEAESFLARLDGDQAAGEGLEHTIKHIINSFFEKARVARTSIVSDISSQYNKTAELERYFKEQIEDEGRRAEEASISSSSSLVLHTSKKKGYSAEQMTIIHHAKQAFMQCEQTLNQLLRYESNLLKTLKEEEEMLLKSMMHWRQKFVKERGRLKVAVQRVKVFLKL